MPENWPGMTGDHNLVRIGASAVGDELCLEQQAAKARPAMWPAQRSHARKPLLDDFPLGLFMDAVDDVEFRSCSRDEALTRVGRLGKPVHPGAGQWVRHATAAYLDGAARTSTAAVRAVAHHWVAQDRRGGKTWELYSWGRRYESADGAVREFRFLRLGRRSGGRRPAEIALAAYTVARGRASSWPAPWVEPFEVPGADPVVVQRVRVLEVSLLDGVHTVLFDGTPEEAAARYAEHARGRVRAVSMGGSPQPGYGCAECKLVTACDALPRFPGLLGITEPAAPLRTWSVTNGRQYAVCPAQDHMIRLKLPRENEYSPAAVRGQAVHEWLAETHAGPLRSPCTVRDIPNPPGEWATGKWRVVGEQAFAGARMLDSHADLCAFHHGDRISEVRLEPTLAYHDTAANVIVIAKPDLLYLEDGAWVWRETKTRQRLPRLGPDLLRDFPQVALATVLMAENALGGKPSGQRIELELLAPDGGDVLLVDPSDPAEVGRARTVIHDLAAPWHADETYAARLGPHCADCPVRRWCPDAEVVA